MHEGPQRGTTCSIRQRPGRPQRRATPHGGRHAAAHAAGHRLRRRERRGAGRHLHRLRRALVAPPRRARPHDRRPVPAAAAPLGARRRGRRGSRVLGRPGPAVAGLARALVDRRPPRGAGRRGRLSRRLGRPAAHGVDAVSLLRRPDAGGVDRPRSPPRVQPGLRDQRVARVPAAARARAHPAGLGARDADPRLPSSGARLGRGPAGHRPAGQTGGVCGGDGTAALRGRRAAARCAAAGPRRPGRRARGRRPLVRRQPAHPP